MEQVANTWMWLGFSVFLIIALSIDTFVIGKHNSHSQASIRRAIGWTLVWVATALLFNLFLWLYLRQVNTPEFASTRSMEFLAGYLIEKSLSIDNLFAFYMIFEHFRIPVQFQQRVLTYGIWGAVIMRLIFILIGVWLLAKFHWLIYVMGIFLLFTGIKMFFMEDKEKDLAETGILKLAKRCFRVTHELDGHHFFVRKNKLLYATPLFIALILVEFSDVVFAFDSIPAIFAVTRDPFIVWSSNIFAILGLRALYFVLANMIARFYLLKYGVALILIFIGTKMVIMPWMHVPVAISLIVIATIIIVFAMLSMAIVSKSGNK